MSKHFFFFSMREISPKKKNSSLTPCVNKRTPLIERQTSHPAGSHASSLRWFTLPAVPESGGGAGWTPSQVSGSGRATWSCPVPNTASIAAELFPSTRPCQEIGDQAGRPRRMIKEKPVPRHLVLPLLELLSLFLSMVLLRVFSGN